jgi:hypothetical protein
LKDIIQMQRWAGRGGEGGRREAKRMTTRQEKQNDLGQQNQFNARDPTCHETQPPS